MYAPTIGKEKPLINRLRTWWRAVGSVLTSLLVDVVVGVPIDVVM